MKNFIKENSDKLIAIFGISFFIIFFPLFSSYLFFVFHAEGEHVGLIRAFFLCIGYSSPIALIITTIYALYAGRKKYSKQTEKESEKEEQQKPKYNKIILIGFLLSLVSIPFYFIGIIPILAVIFSGIGLYQVKKNNNQEKGFYFAIAGLIIGIIYTLMYMGMYGHLSFLNNNDMVRMDGCVSACPALGFGALYGTLGTETPCKANCVEKYGIRIEEYNSWKEKQK